MNRLQHETSPYLLQHKDNPVDWYPWGEEAFQAAKEADKPILLSVGYSACHWCHVMAHESFEDGETAKLMNELYINIKVDREERPDVDDIYMQSVQAIAGRGGWPMTVFLTPEGKPFYGGTYYPKEPRFGMPSFAQVLHSVHHAFANRREEVERSADSLTDSLRRDVVNIGATDSQLNTKLLDDAMYRLLKQVDRVHGGFGDAPKFPQPMSLEFLLRAYQRTGLDDAREALDLTLTKMAQGGMYDQVGGGFARYSVDNMWLVPHFEKMLYDNAQLSRLYLHAWQATQNPFYRRIAEEIYDYILREMTHTDGGFYSATDADSEGEEGKFFVWSVAEVQSILGEDAQIAMDYWGMTERGNFEGHNILSVVMDDETAAKRFGMTADALQAKIRSIKDRLYAERKKRVHPGLDDKIITSWNGMMLASLAEAARVLEREDYRAAAVKTATFLKSQLLDERGRLYRTHKNGTSKFNALLEDYANLIDALLEVYQTTFDVQWFTLAHQLADVVLEHFSADEGGFFDTSDDHETLLVRPRNLQDNATPSGNSMMAKQLIRLSSYTGDSRYDEAARSVLRQLVRAMSEYPQAFGESLNTVDMVVRGVKEVALVGALDNPSLLDILRRPYHPNMIVAWAEQSVEADHDIPLLSYRTVQNNQLTAYVCEQLTCKMPVNTADDIKQLLETGK